MIYKRKKKKCKTCGVPSFIFSKGNCKSCASKTYKRLTKKSPPKKVSDKQTKINAELSKIKQRLIKKHGYVCQGCGVHTTCLELSHIIRRSSRPDLITDEGNCTLHCNRFINNCHGKWDSNNAELMSSLLDYERNMSFISLKDKKRYEEISGKVEAFKKHQI